MINILLEDYRISAPWLYGELREYIKPLYKVTVVAFSFRDSRVKCGEDWDFMYGKENGIIYQGVVREFAEYGISEDNISFVNYFTDSKASATKKIEDSDIIYFLGGLPDKTMERIKEFGLLDVLQKYNGIVMGYSAGAVIQLAQYHLSADQDYPEFGYYEGLSYISEFYLQVHYEDKPTQNSAIQKVLEERNKTVYATTNMQGAILVKDGSIKLIGDVKEFN